MPYQIPGQLYETAFQEARIESAQDRELRYQRQRDQVLQYWRGAYEEGRISAIQAQEIFKHHEDLKPKRKQSGFGKFINKHKL